MDDLVALLLLLPRAEKILLDDTWHLKKWLYSMLDVFSRRHLHPIPVKQLFSSSQMGSAKTLGLSLWEELSMDLIVLQLGPEMGLYLSSSN